MLAIAIKYCILVFRMDTKLLTAIAYNCILALSSKEGIFASSRQEVYGCVFGRDTSITVLKLLNTYAQTKNVKILEIAKNALETLVSLQGKEFNIESGEEPGKCIHEYREEGYERLLTGDRPWYLYPDKKLRNYDSIDATPLMLIALHKYHEVSNDEEFHLRSLTAIEAGLRWVMNYGDKDNDYLIEYELHKDRKCGGLTVQSWTDSTECFLGKERNFPLYPIAAVEVQAISWLALKMWADVYQRYSPTFARELLSYASKMKKVFNHHFIIEDNEHFFAAQALDGQKNQIKTITANPLLCLWASYIKNGKRESILDESYVPHFVNRVFKEDLFIPGAGIRTMSSFSQTFDPSPSSYHNGSFWPMLNGLIHEGLLKWGYIDEAEKLKKATLEPILKFGCPIELYTRDENGELLEYTSPSGHKGCRYQAWSAAAVLDLVSRESRTLETRQAPAFETIDLKQEQICQQKSLRKINLFL